MLVANAAVSTRQVVGVIGGMGPLATAHFLRRLTEVTAAGVDSDHLHVIVDSEPSIPDRTDFLLGRGPDPTPALLSAAIRLEQMGAELLVVPCNTAAAFASKLEGRISIKLVDWVDVALDAALRRCESAAPCCRAGNTMAVGLLATDGTIASQVYQKEAAARGASLVLPDFSAQRRLMEVIYAVKAGKDLDSLRTAALDIADAVSIRSSLVLLGCTEVSVLLSGTAIRNQIPIVDALDEAAIHVVKMAGGCLAMQARRET
jgi:aspartate racemase